MAISFVWSASRKQRTCSARETFLCEQCYPTHCIKRSRSGNTAWPISDILSYKSTHYFDLRDICTMVQAQTRLGGQQPPLSRPPPTYFNSKTPKVVETHYLESIRICAFYFPQSKEHAECLSNLGGLYTTMERLEQEEYFPVLIEYIVLLIQSSIFLVEVGRSTAAAVPSALPHPLPCL